ncbi:MAG: polysaccharide deacetylase [Ruminococcaceae bacterium]|nr:polysaccharide deacetylase [Oscillospiraceae bacterium]
MGEQKRYGKYGANFIAPDNNCVYLTFDCGYEYRITDENGNKVPITSMILDTLKEKNAKGVFFITMDYAKKEPELVQRMINEGHAVGNHTTTHPSMPTLSIDKMVEEVMTLHNYVQERYGYTMTLFRPPEGAFSVQSLAVVHSLGYKTVHWSFAHADWDPNNQPDVAATLQNILKKSHSGAIYLLHAMSLSNATVLGDAIDGFRDKGFSVELFQ